MLDKIKNGVKDIPISAEAFGFAAVVASVAPVPDAIGSLRLQPLLGEIRYDHPQ